jgi:hypothetical protein
MAAQEGQAPGSRQSSGLPNARRGASFRRFQPRWTVQERAIGENLASHRALLAPSIAVAQASSAAGADDAWSRLTAYRLAFGGTVPRNVNNVQIA